MNFFVDVRNWLGGYPFEYAPLECNFREVVFPVSRIRTFGHPERRDTFGVLRSQRPNSRMSREVAGLDSMTIRPRTSLNTAWTWFQQEAADDRSP